MEKIKPDKKQQNRFYYIEKVLNGCITLREAAECIGISYRQAKRLKKTVKEKGLSGLQHGNKGKKPALAIDDDMRKFIISLSQSLYRGLNYTQISEKLLQNHQIEVSRETVRKILASENPGPKHVQKRVRRTKSYSLSGKEGGMVLWGGLTQKWFPDPHPECCFMAAVDMTTLRCLCANFFATETTDGYLWLLKKMLIRCGIPQSLCQHSRNAVKVRKKNMTIKEELQGFPETNPVERALEELGIKHEHIPRRNAVNLLFRLESLLADEIAKHAIQNIREGNLFLDRQFLYDYNYRCSFAPQSRRQAWREVPEHVDLCRICSRYYERTVDCNNTVTINGVGIKISPGVDRISYAMARVEVRRLLNGTWCVYYKKRKIAEHYPTPFAQMNYDIGQYYNRAEPDEPEPKRRMSGSVRLFK